ncbi:MAG: hypothetical protein NT003_02915 [Candidatus Magasanikbacteria bacterium]|nr:hypothetical protein [Candidatus Magasanikbacteria bacterium]
MINERTNFMQVPQSEDETQQGNARAIQIPDALRSPAQDKPNVIINQSKIDAAHLKAENSLSGDLQGNKESSGPETNPAMQRGRFQAITPEMIAAHNEKVRNAMAPASLDKAA